MAQLLDIGMFSIVDTDSSIGVGWKANFYTTGTSTPANTYPTAADADAATNPNANPVIVGADGRIPTVWLVDGTEYKLILTDENDVVKETVDPINRPAAWLRAYNGTAAAPSISFSGDTDTGIFRDSSNVLGVAAGGTAIARFSSSAFAVGSSPTTARVTFQTATSLTGNALDVYHYSDQTNASNQTTAFVLHNYTDGGTAVFDTVGTNTTLVLRNARNPTARADKASTYVGSGSFLDFQRSTSTGTGGNLGTGNNRVRLWDSAGRETRYGVDVGDWDATFGNASDQWRPVTGAGRGLYMGYQLSATRGVVGVIEDGVGFEFLDLAASAVRPVNDGLTDFGAPSLNWRYLYCLYVRTTPVAVAALPAAATAGAGARAFVSDSNAAASGNFGAVVAGGGANVVPVHSTGAAWLIG